MRPRSKYPAVERAQPWLGTLVSVRAEGLPYSDANRAIDAAFGEVAAVHRLMSFHDGASDVGRLNREASRGPVEVDPRTLEVLRLALAIAERSKGCFDISIGAELVEWGLLPPPEGASRPAGGSWRDIELRTDGRVRFHRPLWIDLGGIAKGYAVDRAADRLRQCGATQAAVNAGGDLSVRGGHAERVGLRLEFPADPAPVLYLTNGSAAGSSGHRNRRQHGGRICGPHVHGATRLPAPANRFVCVVAERCVVADALTKVAMAEGLNGAEPARHFGATFHIHDPREGWRHLDGGTK